MINQLQRYCQSNCFHSLSFFALCLSIGVRLCEPSLPLFVLTGCRVTTVTSYSICSGVQSFQYWVAQNWLTKKLYTVFLKRNLFNVEIRWTERFISMICITNSSQNYTKRAVSPYTDWCTPTEHFPSGLDIQCVSQHGSKPFYFVRNQSSSHSLNTLVLDVGSQTPGLWIRKYLSK